MSADPDRPLRILHVLRAPVGGLFRHVMDLASAQAARGHKVGLLADSITGGGRADEALARIAPELALGIDRIPMDRLPSRRDLRGISLAARRAKMVRADIVHGHGAKGGLFARLGGGKALKAYTPHGGSLNYSKWTPGGFLYLGCESLLRFRTDVSLFESEYASSVYQTKVGKPRGIARVVHNGISAGEFEPALPVPEASNLVFVGELARRKGVDILLQALAELNRQGRTVTLTAVGSGPEEDELRALANELGLANQVRFLPPMNARQAFSLGRVLVVPSRAESLPYIVLEGVAASMPIIACNVGGIPEIFGAYADALVPAGDPDALAGAIGTDLGTLTARTLRVRARVRSSFSTEAMCDGIMSAYREGLAARRSR
ncbi:glycosyltransferase family 4 protein [Starkeya sp. ORNL1]|uniref:glycosyltransferase family 4 protein n=1 Tax=Starkeya sp. ORNL1 TaxID=2709380 RepID=UPI00146342DD|nr:glycosyltransferase family 4 protein [Starkeya sp. ORNL1]QJP12709.1 glycosyltransferase family 4 protein [Starkeya sp. ORNL1]